MTTPSFTDGSKELNGCRTGNLVSGHCKDCSIRRYRAGKLGATFIIWMQVHEWHRRIEASMRDEYIEFIRARREQHGTSE